MDPSKEYVEKICSLYDDYYDDREEESRPQGTDWFPGMRAEHKSLARFQKELDEQGIKLSRSKLQKILITGGCWTTERSREIQSRYKKYTKKKKDGRQGLSPKAAVERIADELQISTVAVNINLPYEKVVYCLDKKSGNAKRIDRWRAKKT